MYTCAHTHILLTVYFKLVTTSFKQYLITAQHPSYIYKHSFILPDDYFTSTLQEFPTSPQSQLMATFLILLRI